MSLFSGQRLTERDIEIQARSRVKQIVMRLWNGQINPDEAIGQLIDVMIKTRNVATRDKVQPREGVEHVTK